MMEPKPVESHWRKVCGGLEFAKAGCGFPGEGEDHARMATRPGIVRGQSACPEGMVDCRLKAAVPQHLIGAGIGQAGIDTDPVPGSSHAAGQQVSRGGHAIPNGKNPDLRNQVKRGFQVHGQTFGEVLLIRIAGLIDERYDCKCHSVTCRGDGIALEDVAMMRDGPDQRRAVLAQCLAQLVHGLGQRLIGHGDFRPDSRQQVFLRHRLTRVAGQDFQRGSGLDPDLIRASGHQGTLQRRLCRIGTRRAAIYSDGKARARDARSMNSVMNLGGRNASALEVDLALGIDTRQDRQGLLHHVPEAVARWRGPRQAAKPRALVTSEYRLAAQPLIANKL